MSQLHTGKCFCGAIELEVAGAPEGMGYCHCASCRAWASARVHSWTGWKPEAVTVTRGAEHIGEFSKSDMSIRKFCKQCGSNVMTDHPTLGIVDICAGTLPSLAFEPGAHFHYAETVHRMHDGLPKLKDFPAEFGGSGDTLPE